MQCIYIYILKAKLVYIIKWKRIYIISIVLMSIYKYAAINSLALFEHIWSEVNAAHIFNKDIHILTKRGNRWLDLLIFKKLSVIHGSNMLMINIYFGSVISINKSYSVNFRNLFKLCMIENVAIALVKLLHGYRINAFVFTSDIIKAVPKLYIAVELYAAISFSLDRF